MDRNTKLDEAASHLDLRPLVVLVRRVNPNWAHKVLADALVLLLEGWAVYMLIKRWRIPNDAWDEIGEVVDGWADQAAANAELALDTSLGINPSGKPILPCGCEKLSDSLLRNADREESNEPPPANYEEIERW